MWLSCLRRNVRFVCLRNEVAPACVALLYVRNVMLRKKGGLCAQEQTNAQRMPQSQQATRFVQFSAAFQTRFIRNRQLVVDNASLFIDPRGETDYTVLQAPRCSNRTTSHTWRQYCEDYDLYGKMSPTV